uniref:Putative DNA-binding protein n=1 Tax=Noccaea caerulescens TaxID=107243 RepID=A0A1J3GGV6_NOCCA
MAKRSENSPASQGTGPEPPRSDAAGDAPDGNHSDPTAVSAASGSQKRGRGRPPKPKSDAPANGAVSAQATRKSSRPTRNGAPPAVSAAAAVKNGRGRPKRTISQVVTVPVAATVDGSRKRGRPKKDDVAAPALATVAAPAKKRGRKPQSEQVAATKKTVGRPNKATEATTGQEAADTRELKKKAALLQRKVKQAADKLKIAVSAIEEVQEIAAGM